MPMNDENWNGIFGQDSVKSLLNSLIYSEKIPHAFLFKGNDGVGKEFTAVRFAQALNLRYLPAEKGDHISQLIRNLNEPYIKYIFPLPRGRNETETSGPMEKLSNEDNDLIKEELENKINNPYHRIKIPKANQIKISSIRDIRKFLSMDYSDIKFRFVLISSAHMMNEEAQNALLKNLEEPPEGIIFILTTPFPDQLRETIRSRCWIINFQPLLAEDVENILVSDFKIDRQSAHSAALFSNGSITEAVNLLQHDLTLLKEKTILVLRYSFGRRFHSALEEFNSVLSEQGSESFKILVLMIISWLNDLQKFRAGLTNYFFDDYVETLQKFNLKFSDVELNEIVFKLDKYVSLLKNNVNLNTLTLNIITELSQLTRI
jgi:DNA polymerase-3 subunit delta'